MNKMTGPAMRQMYESGYGILKIVVYTGYPYIDVQRKLIESGTELITGGPHDTSKCAHEHWLAKAHETGACVHPVTAKPHTNKSRAASARAYV